MTGTPVRVLIIEDSEDDTELLVDELRRGGYEPQYERVETADDMREALGRQEWGAILSDYSLPQFSGMHALTLMKDELGFDLPFILVSGVIGEETAVAAMRAGAHDYMMKDNLTRLVAALKRELGDAEARRARKRAEEELRQSEERYRDLVENIQDVIFEIDATLRITYISPRMAEIGAYDTSDLVGKNVAEFVYPDDLSRLKRNLPKRLSGEPQGADYQFRMKSGEMRWFRTSGRPIFERDRIVGYRGVMTDVTERKQAEEALQKAREELEGKVEHQMLRRNPYGLTFRELTVLHLVAAGESDKQIGLTLAISGLTAQKHLENIRGKMGAASRTEASVRAVREGLID